MLQRRPPTGDSVRSRSISPRSSGQPSLGFSPRRKSRVLDSQRLTKRRQDLLALELAQRTEILAFFDVERVRMADLYVKGISASKEATIVRLEQDVDTLRSESDRNLKGYRNDLTTIAKGLSSLLQDCLALGVGGDPDDPERQALEATLKRLQTGSSSASAGKGSGVGSTPGQHDISLLFHGGVDAAITNSYEIGSAASFATSSHSPKRIGSASTSRQANKPSVPQNTNPAISIPSLRRASSSSTSASLSLRHHGGTVAHSDSPYRSIADGNNPNPPIITAKMLQDDISSLSQVLQQLLHSAASRLRYSTTRLTYMETLLDQQQSQLVATDRMLNGYLVRAPTDIDRSIDMVRHMGAEVTAKLAAIESKALTMVDKLLTDSAPLEYLRIQAAKAIREGSNGSLAHSMLASEQQSLKAKFKEEVKLLTEDQAELVNFLRGELVLLTKKRLEVAAGKGDLPSVGDNTPLTLLSLPVSVRHNEAVSLPRLHLIEDQTTSLPVALRVAALNVDASPMGNSSRISLGHTPHPEESSTVVLSPATAQPSPVGSPKQRRIQPVMVLDSNNSSDNTAIYSGTNGFALSATVPLAADKSAVGEMPSFEAPRISTQPKVANQYNPWLASHAHARGGPSHYLHRSNLPPSLRSRLEADVAMFDRTELLRIIDLVSHEPRVAEAITAVMDEYFRWEEGAKQKLQVMEAIGRATAPPPEPTPELSIVETRPRAPTDPPSPASKSGPLVISGGRSHALAGPSSSYLEDLGSQEVVASDPRHEVALNAQRRLYKTFDSLNMGSAIATAKTEAVESILEKQSATTRNPAKELTYGARITDILNEPPAGGDTASGPVLSDRYKRYAQRATPEATDYSHNNLYTREFQSKVLEELYTDTRNRLLEEEGARLEGTDLGTKALNAASAAAAGVRMGVASSHSRPYVPTPIVSKNAVIDPVTEADQPRKALLLASPAGRKWYESSRLHQQGLQDVKAAIASGEKLDGAPQGFDHLPALTDPRGAGREGDSFFYRNPATQTPWTDEEVMRLVKRDEDASRRRRISEASAPTFTNTSILSNSPATSLFKGPMTASNTSFPTAISSQPPLSHTTSAAIAYQSLLSDPPGTLSPPQEPLRSRFDTDNPLAFVPLPPRDPSAESKRVSAQQRKLAAAFGP